MGMAVFSCNALNVDDVYFISGSTDHDVPFGTRLYHVRREQPQSPRLIHNFGQDIFQITIDRESNTATLVTEGEIPALVTLRFENPAQLSRQPLGLSNELLPGSLVLPTTRGLFLVPSFGRPDRQTDKQYRVVKPDGARSEKGLPFVDLRSILVEGNASVASSERQFQPTISGDPFTLVSFGAAAPQEALRRPPYLRRSNPQDKFQIVGSNGEFLVLVPSEPFLPGVLDVLRKRDSSWSRVSVPSTMRGFRCFGPWVAGFEAVSGPKAPSIRGTVVLTAEFQNQVLSPGSAIRKAEVIDRDFTIDELFRDRAAFGEYFPGRLFLVNLATGVKFEIVTGSGDSEVLLVTDDEVIYRVDHSLFSRQFNTSELADPILLATGDAVFLAHWAFAR